MDAASFFKNFETIANAPGGIARLRELILDLAVHGKLVPQIAEEGDASELLYKFSMSEDRLVEQGIINRPRFQREQKIEIVPYMLPESWSWCRIGDVAAVVGGGTPSTTNFSYWSSGHEIPWLTPADMRAQSSRYVMRGSRDITHAGLKESSAQLMPAGTVLFSSRAPIGHVGIAGQSLATNQGFKSCVPYVIEMSEFIYLFLKKAGKEIDAMATGTTFREVSGKQVAQVLMPLPPLEEQKRIVAKVDELMALCDQLESAQQQRDSLRTSARNSAIDAILTASTAEELGAAWKRINQNWTTFADTPESISSLRSLVLDLAIQGLLTNSDLSAWSESNLGDVVEIIRGVTFPASAKQRSPMKGLIPCLRTANVQNEVDWDDLLYISEEYVRKESQIVMKDDILISMANSRELVGKVALVKRDDLRCTLGGFIAALRCSEAILPEFLMSILRVPSARDKLIDSSTQTTNIANISIGRLKPFEIRIPPVEVQKRIVAKVDELMTLCDELENHLRIRNEAQLQLCRAVTSSVAA